MLPTVLDTPAAAVLCGLLVSWALACVAHSRWNSKRPQYPPGPRGIPILGNVFDVPLERPWLAFAEIGKEFGDIFFLRILSQRIVVINSVEVAEDILDAHGALCSDRPVLPMAGELAGFDTVIPLCLYTDRFKKERRMLHRVFGTKDAARAFEGVVTEELQNLVNILHESEGKGLFEHLERITSAIGLRLAYGYRMAPPAGHKDALHEMFLAATRDFMDTTRPAAYMVDIFPFLKYWPESLPGGGFHTLARRIRQDFQHTIHTGLQFVTDQLSRGTAEPSFARTFLEKVSHESDTQLLKQAAAAVQVAGSDTTAAQLSAFFLAMSLYPAVQRRAHAEIDRVLRDDDNGDLRLATTRDREEGLLPYMDAFCKELLRWHVAAPIAVPHCAKEAFVYTHRTTHAQLFIPKGTVIMPNIWKMAHDADIYPDPFVFNPERFLGPQPQPDPRKIVFGFGRRICPGRLLGDSTVFLACTTILASFEITAPDGNEVKSIRPHAQASAFVSHPEPFECVVTPRQAQRD